MINHEKFISALWPADGPHTPESVTSAALAIAQLYRYLVAAMGPRAAAADVVENLADAHELVGTLAAADLTASEYLVRLGHWAVYIGARSAGTQHYGITDPDGSPDQIQSLMDRVTRDLRTAATHHAASADHLNRAHNQLGFTYTNQT